VIPPCDSLFDLVECIVLARLIELCETGAHPSPLDELKRKDDDLDPSGEDAYVGHVLGLCTVGCTFCELDALDAVGKPWIVIPNLG
jgi:hypothetical protein